MVKGKIIKGKKQLIKSSEPFISKRTLIIISVLIVLGGVIGVILYFTVFKKSSSSSGGGGNTPEPNPNPSPGPNPGPGPTIGPGPPGPFNLGSWDGWSTTTRDTEPYLWPGTELNPYTSFDLNKIVAHGNGNTIGSITTTTPTGTETIDVVGTMGVAIPWAIFSSVFKWQSRIEFISTVINSCNGTNDVPCCLIVQPIGKFPDEILPVKSSSTNSIFDMVNNLCTTNCMDISDPNITATYNNGNKYPAYFLIPFQGCGGFCYLPPTPSGPIPTPTPPPPPSWPDCFNSSSDVNALVNNFNYYTNCKQSDGNPIPVPINSKQIKWMSDNKWLMNSTIEQSFYNDNDATFAISDASSNGRNIVGAANTSKTKKRINYCSGKNMHFDVQTVSGLPFWCNLNNGIGDVNNSINLTSSDGSSRGGDISNGTMVRYMFVRGNIFGNFNILADGGNMPPLPLPTNVCPGSGGGGGSGKCGKTYGDPNICKQPSCVDDTNCPTEFPNCYNIPC